MADLVRYTIPRLKDSEIYRKVSSALETEFPIAAYQAMPVFGGDHIKGTPDSNPQLAAILDENTVALRRIEFLTGNQTRIEVNRGWDGQSHTLKGLHDEVTVDPKQEQDPSRVARLIRLVRNALGTIDELSILDFMKEEDRTFYQARETSLQRLQELQESFFLRLQDFGTEQAETYQKRLDQLEDKYSAKSRELDERHFERATELDERDAQLAKRQQLLDDRASTHVRRELREKLQERLQERASAFELTGGTKRRRHWVLAGFLILLAATGAVAGFAYYSDPTGADLVTVARR